MNKRKKILKWSFFVSLVLCFGSKAVFGMPMNHELDKGVETLSGGMKTIYITFDDGPSVNNTEKIIDILVENDVRATFFVIGQRIEEYRSIADKLHKNNMCMAPHCYNHEYEILFRSLNSYSEDLEKCGSLIKEITGNEPIPYTRIPGGAYNTTSNKYVLQEIRSYLSENEINYVGWNVVSQDALGRNIPAYKLIKNVKDQTESLKDNDKDGVIVLLMHDSYYKKTTVEALPEIIRYYKELGYTFKTFDEITTSEYNELLNLKLINK
ncbi:polysaccharide deacetylase family protein [Clostridium sp. DL1XJH146]